METCTICTISCVYDGTPPPFMTCIYPPFRACIPYINNGHHQHKSRETHPRQTPVTDLSIALSLESLPLAPLLVSTRNQFPPSPPPPCMHRNHVACMGIMSRAWGSCRVHGDHVACMGITLRAWGSCREHKDLMSASAPRAIIPLRGCLMPHALHEGSLAAIPIMRACKLPMTGVILHSFHPRQHTRVKSPVLSNGCLSKVPHSEQFKVWKEAFRCR